MTNRPFLPYGRQLIDDDDVEAVVEALRSPFLTTGPKIGEFEAALAKVTGARHVVAVSNGTAALHAAAFAAEVGPGDEVLVPAITFVASANCARYLGADVQFVDVDPDTALIDLQDLEARISSKTKAVVAVDMAGAPAHLNAIRALCDAHGASLIEDAAHSLGATYAGHRVGGRPADLATFSFHPVKHITTGEGGAVTTDDDELARRLRLFRDHGLNRTEDQFEHASPGPWYYEQAELGHNLRLSALQCALGLSQLAKLDGFLERRRTLIAQYETALAGLDGAALLSRPEHECVPAYHLAVALLDFERLGRSRHEVMEALREKGIGTQVHYIPVCAQPYYRRLGNRPEDYPGAQRYYERCLSLPLFPGMQEGDVDRVVGALADLSS